MTVWLVWLGKVLNLDRDGVSSCSFLKTGGTLLLTGRRAWAHTEHNDFVVRKEELSWYLFLVNCEVSAHLYVILGEHVSVQYSGARK